MALNAVSLRLKAANRYHADRPCGLLLADGTQAGITAGKNGTPAQLLAGFSPDALPTIASWKTAPWGSARNTLYSGGTTAVGSITAWSVREAGRYLSIVLETGGASPVMNGDSVAAGEVLVAHATGLGESATYGNADGLTMYGMLMGIASRSNGSGAWMNTSSGSRFFLAAEATAQTPTYLGNTAPDTTATARDSAYWAGSYSTRDFEVRVSGGLQAGRLSYHYLTRDAAHWTARTVDGITSYLVGSSTTVSNIILTPKRKDGASAETVVHSRKTGTWATWTAFLQDVADTIPTLGLTSWEIDQTA